MKEVEFEEKRNGDIQRENRRKDRSEDDFTEAELQILGELVVLDLYKVLKEEESEKKSRIHLLTSHPEDPEDPENGIIFKAESPS